MTSDVGRQPSLSVDSSSHTERIHWMDFLRGAAIIALLIGHASAIPYVYQNVDMGPVVVWVNNFFGPYRMPVLMFLSGMLLGRSLKRSAYTFYSGKITKLLWPYGVWALIFLATTDQLSILFSLGSWVPVTYIWFLLFVFLYYCMAPLLARLPPLLVPALAIAGSLMVADRGFISNFILFAAYFYLGHQLASSPAAQRLVSHWAVRWPALLVTVALNVVVPGSTTLVSLLTTFSGILAIVGWSSVLYRKSRLSLPIEFVGRNSIVYYLTHYPLMIGIGNLLLSVGLDNFWILFCVNLMAAVVIGTVGVPLGRRYPVKLLFEFPQIGRRARSSLPRS